MRLGYNTNGFAHHDPLDAIDVIHHIGYQSVALTVDHFLLNPKSINLRQQVDAIQDRLERYGLASVIESGARFLLDPFRKHQPTLLSPDPSERQCRVDFLRFCIDMAARMGSDCMSFWSGTAIDDAADEVLLERLADSMQPLLEYADDKSVTLGFEPEPGMFIDSMAAFERFLQWSDAPHLKVTMDLGHLYCQGEVPMVDYMRRYADRIVNIHIEDMRAGVHEHLMFGEGEIHFPPVIEGLADIGFQGGVHVELSRHSHMAPAIAQQSFDFLSPLISAAGQAES